MPNAYVDVKPSKTVPVDASRSEYRTQRTHAASRADTSGTLYNKPEVQIQVPRKKVSPPAAAAPPINHVFRHLLGFQMLSSLSRRAVVVSSTSTLSPPRFPRRALGVATSRSAADGFRGSITWYFRRTNRRFFSPFPSKKSTLSGSSSSL